MKNWVAESIASDVNDFTPQPQTERVKDFSIEGAVVPGHLLFSN